MNVQVAVFDIERQGESLAMDGGGQRGGGVEVEHVSELVGARGAVGLDAGGPVARVVASAGRLSQRPEQVAQGLVAEEIEALVRDFKASLALGPLDFSGTLLLAAAGFAAIRWR